MGRLWSDLGPIKTSEMKVSLLHCFHCFHCLHFLHCFHCFYCVVYTVVLYICIYAWIYCYKFRKLMWYYSSEGVSECSSLAWHSKCSILAKLRKANSTHLALLKYQNTKTCLYKLSMINDHWVISLFEIFLSVRKILQSTVSLDHPVIQDLSCKITL